MLKGIQNITLGLTSAILLTACTSSNDSVTTPVLVDKQQQVIQEKKQPLNNYKHNSIAKDATEQEIKRELEYESHLQKVEKHKKKKKHSKKRVVDLKKFCFKDNTSIHYRKNERCK